MKFINLTIFGQVTILQTRKFNRQDLRGLFPTQEAPVPNFPFTPSENPNGVSYFSPGLARFREGRPWVKRSDSISLSSEARRVCEHFRFSKTNLLLRKNASSYSLKK
jgi:hypothetical protein